MDFSAAKSGSCLLRRGVEKAGEASRSLDESEMKIDGSSKSPAQEMEESVE
jgi:hypothetical protein